MELDKEALRLAVEKYPGHCAVYRMTEDHKLEFLLNSKALTEVSGFTEEEYEELAKDDALNVIAQQERELAWRHLEKCLKPPYTAQFRFRLRAKHAPYVWIMGRVRLYGIYDGRPVVLIDFSDTRAEAEEKAALLDRMDFRVYVVDAETHELLYLNKAAKRTHPEIRLNCDVATIFETVFHDDFPIFTEEEYTSAEPREMERSIFVNERHLRGYFRPLCWYGRRAVIMRVFDVTSEIDRKEQLEHTRRMYESVTGLEGIVVWEYDVRNHRVYMPTVTEKLAAIYKCKPGAIWIENVPDSLLPLVEERSKGEFLQMYRDIEAGADRAGCEVWYARGAELPMRCISIRYNVVKDEHGYPVYAYGVARNITEQRLSEESYAKAEREILKEKNENIGSLHFNLTQNLCRRSLMDADSLLDDTGLMLSGTYEQFVVSYGNIIFGPERHAAFMESYSREALLAAYHVGKVSHRFNFQLKTVTGELVWLQLETHIMRNPHSGDIEGFMTTHDIDRQMKREQIIYQLMGKEYGFVALMHVRTGMTEFYSWKHEPTLVIRLQKGKAYSLEDLQRFARERYKETSILDRIDIETIVKQLNRRAPFFITLYMETEQGLRRKQLEFNWFDERHEDIRLIESDVTEVYLQEQKHAQELERALSAAEQANEAKSAFLSNLSHDMRTPLNGILGFTDIALKSEDIDQIKRCLEQIKTSGALLLALINDTLDLSKIASGKITLDVDDLNLTDIMREITVPIRAQAEERRMEFVVDRRRLTLEYVQADGLKLQKIILNLLSNALKFTPMGGKIELIAEDAPAINGMPAVHFVVRDNGLGIDPAFMPHLFQAFAQENSRRTRHIAGTGLGLAIVKQMVELMGGHIEVKSEVAKGTQFDVYIPMRKSGAEMPLETDADTPDEAQLAGHHVLICEDNEVNMEITKYMLESVGIECIEAQDGKEGVDIFETSAVNDIDAVLMDLRMPVMNGFEATKAIRSLNRPDAKTVPIIALSGDAYDEDVRRSLEVGMDGHLAKPVDFNKLKNILGRCWKRRI